MIRLPEPLKPVTDHLIEQHTFPVIVGGYVRDALLGYTSKDIDIEVYNVTNIEALKTLLEPFGSVNLVGKSFGVLKMAIDGYDIDFALPRTESKKEPGHRGFDVTLSGQLDFATAAMRRDFTVNAMGFDINASYLLDPYKGQDDLKARRLRCVNKKTFVEDPLRVLRAVQMAARFELECDDALILLCRKMVKEGMLEELPKERIFEEFRKLLLKAKRPSVGMRLMVRIDLLGTFPELSNLYNSRALDNDAWERTLKSLDIMASMRHGDDKNALALMLAVLCHAFAEDEEPVRHFLSRLSDDKELSERVLKLVNHQGVPLRYYQQDADNGKIRRIALAVPLEPLVDVAKAVYLGQTACDNGEGEFLAGDWLLHRAKEANATAEALRPILQGRDLIAEGYTPSPEFKAILDRAYEAQLDGLFDTRQGALEWLKAYRG